MALVQPMPGTLVFGCDRKSERGLPGDASCRWPTLQRRQRRLRALRRDAACRFPCKPDGAAELALVQPVRRPLDLDECEPEGFLPEARDERPYGSRKRQLHASERALKRSRIECWHGDATLPCQHVRVEAFTSKRLPPQRHKGHRENRKINLCVLCASVVESVSVGRQPQRPSLPHPPELGGC